MTRVSEDNKLVAEVLMDRCRVKTVPLEAKAFEFINATLSRDRLMDDAAVGSVLYQKTVPLNDGMHLSIYLYNGSYKGESRTHLEMDIHKSVSYKPDEDVEMPLAWTTVTDKIPDDVVFKGSSLGMDEDYHIRIKVESS